MDSGELSQAGYQLGLFTHQTLLNDLLFNFMQMSVLLVCSYVHHNVQCPQRPEECQISCGCWGQNPGALKELLTEVSHLPVLPIL